MALLAVKSHWLDHLDGWHVFSFILIAVVIVLDEVAECLDMEMRHATWLEDVAAAHTLALFVVLVQLKSALLLDDLLGFLATAELFFCHFEYLILVASSLAHLN